MDLSWTCPCCGDTFDTLPMSYMVGAPRQWLALTEAERLSRGAISSDACIIDGTAFYVLGCLDLPVRESDQAFTWNAWVSVSEASYRRIEELWEVAERAQEPPRFGWLDSWITSYPEPVAIKCRLHFRDDFQRPFIELEPTDHPLAVEQREGITLDRVKAIAAAVMQHQSDRGDHRT